MQAGIMPTLADADRTVNELRDVIPQIINNATYTGDVGDLLVCIERLKARAKRKDIPPMSRQTILTGLALMSLLLKAKPVD